MLSRAMKTALGLFSLTTIIFWLPLIRGAFDGSTYTWGVSGFGGRGTGGDYWLPVIGTVLGLAVLAAGWRGIRWAFGAIGTWSTVLLVGVLVRAVSHPEEFRFRGDTLGIEVSLAWLGPVLLAGMLAASLVAARQAPRTPPSTARPWDRRNRVWLALLGGLLPVQFLLLRSGAPGSGRDQLGVVLTIGQWFLVGRIFRRYPAEDAAPRAP